MINTLHNISFKGIVVANGTAKELRSINELYEKEYFADDYFSNGSFELRRYPKTFRDYQNYSLTGIYDDGQKYAENLYITNEDTPRLKEYLRQKQSKGKRLTGNESTQQIIETLKNNLKLIKNEIKPYKNSLKSENTHNDYLIDLYLAAQKTLVNIFGEKDALNVPKMKASEILDAIKNRKWDFVNCKIIK
ncbi:MAG: hypothetical protein ACLSUS_04200 [Opitutales bacterium]